MFKKLQKKWQVSPWNLFFILCTFALGGSACGRFGTFILNNLSVEKGPVWFVLYAVIITLLWPVCVLLISIPLGQYRFFRNYISRIWKKISGKKTVEKRKINLAVFASGTGSNTLNIINYFNNHPNIAVNLVVAGNSKAGVIQIAYNKHINCLILDKNSLYDTPSLLQKLEDAQVDFLILAGFLKKIPVDIINQYHHKILNIHPALLPAFGGKGMYGKRVHDAVVASGVSETGITIHVVDEEYDHGDTVFQARYSIEPGEDAASIEKKVRQLEIQHYPAVIESFIQKQMLR